MWFSVYQENSLFILAPYLKQDSLHSVHYLLPRRMKWLNYEKKNEQKHTALALKRWDHFFYHNNQPLHFLQYNVLDFHSCSMEKYGKDQLTKERDFNHSIVHITVDFGRLFKNDVHIIIAFLELLFLSTIKFREKIKSQF